MYIETPGSALIAQALVIVVVLAAGAVAQRAPARLLSECRTPGDLDTITIVRSK